MFVGVLADDVICL